jgi:hypothetical protein
MTEMQSVLCDIAAIASAAVPFHDHGVTKRTAARLDMLTHRGHNGKMA